MSNEIWVIDDMRELPPIEGCSIKHFKTDPDFITFITSYANESNMYRSDTVTVIIDHDAGGVAFGEDTFRGSVRLLCSLSAELQLPKLYARIVTFNPDGAKWIAAELEKVGIEYDIDPGGRETGMKAPKGW
jgi:hypothetical protein